MSPLVRASYIITWVITGFLTGISLYVIADSLFLSSGTFSRTATVDNPDLYIVQGVNEERSRINYPMLHNNPSLAQVANLYTLEYQTNGNTPSIDSVRLVYDLYMYQYFIGDVVHQINGFESEPLNESNLSRVLERVKIYARDQFIEDIGVSVIVNEDNSFYYMVLLAMTEKLTAPYANPSYIGDFSQAGQLNAIVAMLNNARTAQGLGQLRPNPTLNQVAYNHSVDQAQRNRMGHDGSNGSNPQSRITGAGYQGNATGENVLVRPNAYAAGAFNQWWNSPDHYATMMHSAFTEIGIAFAVSNNGNYYYTMALGG